MFSESATKVATGKIKDLSVPEKKIEHVHNVDLYITDLLPRIFLSLLLYVIIILF